MGKKGVVLRGARDPQGVMTFTRQAQTRTSNTLFAVRALTDGSAWISGMGSNHVIRASVDGTRLARVDVGQGPTGLVLSADGGKLYDPASRVLRRAYVFVMVLGYSRHMFAQIVFDQSTETWIGTWKLKVSSPSTSAFFIN